MTGYKAKNIKIGRLQLGGDYPVRIQSMTSTDTMDTQATVNQAIRMVEAGCEMVRITAQGIAEAKNLTVIKQKLKTEGYDVPLIADVHFNPGVAEVAAAIVEKVRINPGNYVDKNKGKTEYTEQEYREELKKIKKRLTPLTAVCKKHNTVLRIGINHGSLSERILSRYGDTPKGMVESAMEFLRIFKELDFNNIVLSMKASNVKVMIRANRLLVEEMQKEGFDFPLHLGVTEAGDAEDGRIKSAAGIATLLLDGIGDTIRVSLTEDPEFEMPVAKTIVDLFGKRENNYAIAIPQGFSLHKSVQPVVVTTYTGNHPAFWGNFYPDYLFTGNGFIDRDGKTVELFSFADLKTLDSGYNSSKNKFIVLNTGTDDDIRDIKKLLFQVKSGPTKNAIILKRNYGNLPQDMLLIRAAGEYAYLLNDNLIDGIWLESASLTPPVIAELSFGILQATGDRISKTEYIACPSCGRTLFNIQEVLQKVKSKTAGMKGVKIAVMGCIVNGIGEMADADYGYVGTGKGKVSIYRKQSLVLKNVDEKIAVDELVRIINEDGKKK